VASNDHSERHRDVVTKFQRIVAQGSVYTNSHPAKTVDLLAEWSSLEPQVAAHTPRMTNGTVLHAVQIQALIDTMAKYRAIPKGFEAREIIAR
jgi:ABC-type nitrate/sulfonate/bicarbonate transport system substrate-binding protein